jgi:hypothetical protein
LLVVVEAAKKELASDMERGRRGMVSRCSMLIVNKTESDSEMDMYSSLQKEKRGEAMI